MGTIDIMIILGMIFFMVLGFRDGFMKKLYGIIGFWVGLITATQLMPFVGMRFANLFSMTKELSHIVAFCVIFLIVVVLENVFWRWFGAVGGDTRSMKQRLGGVLIGTLQGLVAVSLFLVMSAIVNLPPKSARERSSLYTTFLHFAPSAYDFSTTFIRSDKGFLDMLKDNFKGIDLP